MNHKEIWTMTVIMRISEINLICGEMVGLFILNKIEIKKIT
jgi:hypothetical protein